MKVILYSNHCPMCKILTQKLKNTNIQFEEINDIDLMISKGFTSMPMLKVDNKIMNMQQAIKWINEREGNNN